MKFKTYLFRLLPAVLVTLMFGCADDKKESPKIPATYTFTDYNATEGKALTTQLAAFSDEVKKGRTGGVFVEAGALTALWTAGSPSLKDAASPYYGGKVEGWNVEIAKASGHVYTDAFPVMPDGGVVKGFLFDEQGVDLEEWVGKGLYSALLHHRAVNVYLADDVSPVDVDNAFSLYGAQLDFPNNSKDTYGAKYAARRDNAGFYTALKDAFLRARVAAGSGDKTEVTKQTARIRENWEKALAATSINYLYEAAEELGDAVGDTGRAEPLHDWAEAVGFLHGLRTVSGKIITDAKIDEILTLMRAPVAGPATPTEFNTPTKLDDLHKAINALAAAYGFSDPTIFKINDVSANKRD